MIHSAAHKYCIEAIDERALSFLIIKMNITHLNALKENN